MEMKCPQCDFVARGGDEVGAKEQLKEHMKSVHQVDESGFENMMEKMKEKITGMFKI